MFKFAIVGRPNVGKSTLFNRLAGRRLALVDDQPGVTRDRREAEMRLGDTTATIIDTAGYEDANDASLEARMRQQTEAAIAEADHTLFVVDARAGVTPLDEIFAETLRRAGRPVTLIANKCEGKAAEAGMLEAYALGFGEPLAVSAEHGLGLADIDAVLSDAREALEEESAAPDGTVLANDDENGDASDSDDPDAGLPDVLQIAIVGRPNAGKSTLINTLIGVDRLLTGPEAGITRDAISVEWDWAGSPVRLFDTAGMRKKARISERLEKMSIGETLRAIRFAHVVMVLMDAAHPLEKQDLQIADLVIREGRALILVVNKIDSVDDLDALRHEVRLEVERLLPQVRGVPIHFVSGQTGRGLDKLMRRTFDILTPWTRRIATSPLNRWLDEALSQHPPPAPSGRRIKIRYITQPKTRPPSFVAFCSRPDALPESYKRYLINGLRESFDLTGIPLRLSFRKGKNPYADK